MCLSQRYAGHILSRQHWLLKTAQSTCWWQLSFWFGLLTIFQIDVYCTSWICSEWSRATALVETSFDCQCSLKCVAQSSRQLVKASLVLPEHDSWSGGLVFFLATVILLLLFTDDSHWLFVFTLCCLCVRIQIQPDFKTRLLLNASIWNNYVMFISHFVVADTCRHWAAGSPQAVGDGTGGLPRQRCLSKHPKDAGPLFGLKNVKLHQP